MNKYLVDIYLPACGKRYDVYLPAGIKVGEATNLLINMMESLSKNNFKGTKNTVLINADNGNLFDCNVTVHDAGVRNSSRLILI